jgi:tetratricopeptide (TPR) repeat protein
MPCCRAHIKLFVVLLIALISVFSYVQPERGLLSAITEDLTIESDIRGLLQQAKSFEDAGFYRNANRVYRRLYDMKPVYTYICFYFMARNFERMGEAGRAMRWYARLLSAGSRVEAPDFDLHTLTLASLKRIYLLGTEHDSAGRYLDRFSRSYPASSYFGALLTLHRRDTEEAAHRAQGILNSDEEPYTSLLLKKLVHDRAVIGRLKRMGFTTESLVDLSMEKGLYQEALSYSYLLSGKGEIIGKRALCSFQLRDFETAVPLFQEYHWETGNADALLKIAYAAFYEEKYGQAREYLLRYASHLSMESAGKHMDRAAAYLQVQLNMRGRDVEKSLNSVSGYLRAYEGSRSSDILATEVFYDASLKGFHSRALQYLHDVRSYMHTAYYQAWAAYMLGIYTGSPLLADAVQLRPGSYYSFRAALLLGTDAEGVKDRPQNSIVAIESVTDSIMHELFCLGYLEEIEEMLQSVLLLTRKDGGAGYHFLLSKIAYARGDPYGGIAHAEKLLTSLGSPALLLLPPEVLELLYPLVFLDIINDTLRGRNPVLEPFIVLAIIREESRYNTQARSAKGALGLMQLMPDTASWILQDDISAAQLVEQSVNISAGTAYLDYLYRRFDSTEYVVASYNGGPNNVAKWIRSNPGRSLEHFIEEIPYRETRNFVKRVYTSYHMYRYLYTDGHQVID